MTNTCLTASDKPTYTYAPLIPTEEKHFKANGSLSQESTIIFYKNAMSTNISSVNSDKIRDRFIEIGTVAYKLGVNDTTKQILEKTTNLERRIEILSSKIREKQNKIETLSSKIREKQNKIDISEKSLREEARAVLKCEAQVEELNKQIQITTLLNGLYNTKFKRVGLALASLFFVISGFYFCCALPQIIKKLMPMLMKLIKK
jgi:uncharacterized coiled-coil protein SlyX